MSTNVTDTDVRDVLKRVQRKLVHRERELELILAAVAGGRDIVLVGPPGTGKTTILRAIAAEWGLPLILVEGNADLTPSKLLGHHNPARVLQEDYSPDNFVAGPLVEAMLSGAFLYLEEFNRTPDDTLNTLLAAMSERRIMVPRVGSVQASPSFRVIASMNPYDNVGTSRISTSIHDRLCRLAVDYQDEQAERRIAELRSDGGGPLGDELIADSVALTRATRDHEDVRQGSSVRGAIDLVIIAKQLATLRTVPSTHDASDALNSTYVSLMLDAMILALSGRIHVDEVSGRNPEAVLRDIWAAYFSVAKDDYDPG